MPLDDTTPRERENARHRLWYAQHRDEQLAYFRRYRAQMTDEQRQADAARGRLYRAQYAHEVNERGHIRRVSQREVINARSRAKSRALREEMIAAYGGCCACCGETTYEFLALDHINGGGKRARETDRKRERTETLTRRLKSEGWPKENHRVLCHNCNMSYGFYGCCPHQVTASGSGPPA